MGKNYAIERAKFEHQQRQQAELYRKLGMDEEQIQTMQDEGTYYDYLNQLWRNFCINDTYEPGSTFKIITMAAGLSARRRS